MNILELAILKKMVGGGGGSGTDNYNDLSNLPQINGETLAGNKTAENLGLQDALTFDSAPTEDSTNPVESGGVYNALAGKQDNLTFDDDPTENSTNPVKSGGVYSALAGKQDNLTFDGVYNASTNKAATESTVTNAIAGLDVSDFSVDADETISSISETDGKINVTKQDIAIASNQVTAMTGYTKPSSAPATPAIQTSDTANQAFGKLEFKADTNQTNILYALNRTGKNLIDFKFNDTPTQGTGYYWDTSCDLPAGTYSISFLLTSTQQVAMTVTVDGSETTKYLQTGTKVSHVYTFTANSAITSVKFWINGGTNIIYDFMISLKDVYDADPTYESYSAQNYDLTYLQAEDRAALAEVVDSGAKNKLQYDLASLKAKNTDGTWNNNAYTIGGITYTLNSDMSISISGTRASTGNAIFNLADYTAVNGDLMSQGTVGVQGVFFYARSGSSSCNTVGYTDIASTDVGVNRTYALAVTAAGLTINQRYYPMICTKAAFGVSQKFVPYKQPERLLIHDDNTTQSNSFTFNVASVQKGTYFMTIDGSSAPTNRSPASLYLLSIFTSGDLYVLVPVKESTGNTISNHSISGTTVTFNLDATKYHSVRLLTMGFWTD